MNKQGLFLVARPVTELELLRERRQALDDAIWALEQYRRLFLPESLTWPEPDSQ